ncbi:hypothetical protein JTE90_014248 [Oedothorax gibbosus]|uniref:Kinesin motor domain-containing protein n=1 Tax=Oedothorax gibbosus TaxID=931172 RepID=A0AAV6U9P6_9ARAC|nr:hypothetical protein JTE90_014248 [Oedothorax gibbosus]
MILIKLKMSRIPPPAFRPVATKINDENKPATFKKPSTIGTLRAGVKRPGDNQVALSEKRQKVAVSGTLKKTFGPSENSRTLVKNAGFSEKAKRAALQPISESVLMRGSMPAMSLSNTLKKPVAAKAKRPAWDLKGRIQDMEEKFQVTQEKNSTLNEQLTIMNEQYNQRIAALESANSMLHKDVEIKSTLTEEASSQVCKLQKELKEKTEMFEKEQKEKDEQLLNIKAENNKLKNELSCLKTQHDNLQNTYQQETTALKNSITTLTCSKAALQAEFSAAELLMENLRNQIKQLTAEKCSKENECESLETRVSELESKLMDEECTRRKLHNTIQELKGNIRVYCRIRPALAEEIGKGMQLASISMPDQKTIELESNENGKATKKYDFSFDSVFPPTASQQEIFEEISQLVQSSIDGYNVCIFAYGQTGSGKTYTMEGPGNVVDFFSSESEGQVGMIPRSVKQIFACIENLEPRGWRYRVEALFLEIYNERIQDLLSSDSQNLKCDIIKSAGKGNDCLLSNVTASPVTSVDEVYSLLNKARINRVVAATKCNEHSSRSHYVFQLKIYGANSLTGERCEGILNLVDLAGSERVKDSGSAGNRLTEAKAINKSLSNLGKVIMSLSKKENHIPYRDSKLTHLLANSLGGNSKTLMFVNISPDIENVNESINSLRFATMVNQCNIGTAQKRVK